MKLYAFPVSTGSLPVLLLVAENRLPVEIVPVDLMAGAQKSAAFLTVNPCGQIPVLEDDGFVLTESSAILKYLADRFELPSYPRDLRARARVNERMDWFNTGFSREWMFHLVYPQILPDHARFAEAAQRETLAWGRAKSEHWLGVLDRHLLGARPFLCGDAITIADYFGAEMIAMGDLAGASVERFPNVQRWMDAMRTLPSWAKVNEGLARAAAARKNRGVGASPGPISGLRFAHAAICKEARDIERDALAVDGPERAAGLASRLAFFANELHQHTRAEEQSIFPTLAARVAGADAPYLHDHRDEDALFAELSSLAERVAAGEGDGALTRLRRQAVVLAEHVVSHVAKENEIVIPQLEALLPPEAQSATFGKMMIALAPGMPTTLPWMVRQMEAPMRAEFLGTLQRALPPDRFRAFGEMVRVGVDLAVWTDLCERVPALARPAGAPS